MIPYIRAADEDSVLATPSGKFTAYEPPEKLLKLLDFHPPAGEGKGKGGLLELTEKVLQYSVNTWGQGFVCKLYASTNAVRILFPRE